MSEEVVEGVAEEAAPAVRKKKPYVLEVRETPTSLWEAVGPVCGNKAEALALLKAFDGETEFRVIAVCSQGTMRTETVTKSKIMEG